jgi:iron complex transport system substrate-binding protein
MQLDRRHFLELAGAAGAGLAAFGLVGCGETKSKDATDASSDATRTVTDMSGVEVTIPESVDKYAEDWYAHNEIDIMLDGAKGMVMTNCSKEDFPWMYKVCPEMENAYYSEGESPNFDKLVDLGPQVMFTQTDDLRDKCKEVDIAMINVMFKTFDEMQKSVTLTADVFGGDAVDTAKSYNDALQKQLDDLSEKFKDLSDDDKPRVLTGNSVYTLDLDGTGTIIEAWIDACGGKQVVTGNTTGSTESEYSLEQIIAWDPEIIITDVADQVDKIYDDEQWSAISAVKNKQVYVNPTGVFMWNRYGVEELLQLKWASKLFHPDMFEDVDIEAEVKDFYSKFLNYDLTDQEVSYILEAKDPDGSDHDVKKND